jgi:hypothetical protein
MSAARAPRVVGWVALAGVSLIAGIASYFHALAVVQAAGATPPVAYLVPALADLVILGASADLLAASRAGQPRPRLTMLALGTGIAVTLAMNVVASHPHAMPSWLVDGWPAVAFVLALESLAGLVRRGRGGDAAPAVPAASGHGEPGVPLSTEAALRALLASDSERALAGAIGIPRSRVQALKRQVADVAEQPSMNGEGSHD